MKWLSNKAKLNVKKDQKKVNLRSKTKMRLLQKKTIQNMDGKVKMEKYNDEKRQKRLEVKRNKYHFNNGKAKSNRILWLLTRQGYK